MNNLCMDCKSLPERYIDPTGYRPHWYSNPGNEGSGGGSLIYAALQRQMGNHGINYQGGSGSGEGGNASSGSYYYDWDDEVYRDSFTNEKVEFSEVYTNFVQPNSTGYSFDYDYGFEKVISSISFNSDEGEYGIDQLTLKIEYKNALVLKLVLKKPMLPIQDQNGGDDGISMNDAGTMLSAFGYSHFGKTQLLKWGMKGADWGKAGANYLKFNLKTGKTVGYAGVGIYGFNSYSSFANGSNLQGVSNGLMSMYSFIATKGGVPGMVITAPFFIIDATIGLDNAIQYQINFEIDRSSRMSNGDWSLWSYPRFGQSYR
jgi:hypothetical protein